MMETPETTKWYVAIVHTNSEHTTARLLEEKGIEAYVPQQPIVRIRKSGRKVKAVKTVIPGVVFVKCTETLRKTVVVYLPTVSRFMMDGTAKERRVAVVPEHQIEILRFMVGQSDVAVDIESRQFVVGRKVRVVRGALKGLEGIVREVKSGMNELIVQLDMIGCAKLSIESANLVPVDD